MSDMPLPTGLISSRNRSDRDLSDVSLDAAGHPSLQILNNPKEGIRNVIRETSWSNIVDAEQNGISPDADDPNLPQQATSILSITREVSFEETVSDDSFNSAQMWSNSPVGESFSLIREYYDSLYVGDSSANLSSAST